MWIDDLPPALKAKVSALIQAQPSSEALLTELHNHLTLAKKRKVSDKPKPSQSSQPATATNGAPVPPAGPTRVEMVTQHILNISGPISPNEVIFELPGLSFSLPNRRKLNFLFHLFIGENNTPLPVLSVVNPANNIPEMSLTNLQSAIRLCVLMPILGNTTVPTKKDTAMLCFWLHKEALAPGAKDEPIICTLHLDSVKKQLVKDGKIPPNAEAQIAHMESTPDAIKPINELIIDFLQRQFSLCGVKLINYLPSTNPTRNTLNLNEDNAIFLSQKSTAVNDFLAVTAYKGSKDGTLLFIAVSDTSAYLVFGFRKPILLFSFADIKSISYKDIARFTFSILVTLRTEKEETYEFSMVDHKSHLEIDEFVKRMNIEDNSFDEIHREKRAEDKEAKTEAAEGVAAGDEDEDEEEDGNYTGGAAEGEESDSDVADEFDSNAESEEDMSDDDADEITMKEEATEEV